MRRSAELSEAALARIEALMPLTCINCKGASLVEPESTVFGDSAEVTGEDVRRSAARRVHRAIPACHRRAVTARGLQCRPRSPAACYRWKRLTCISGSTADTVSMIPLEPSRRTHVA